MNSYNLPDVTSVLFALTVWLTGLAAISWMSLGGSTSVLALVPPLFLTVCAIAAGVLLFTGTEQNEVVTEEVRARLTLKDAPAGQR
jgi:DMSO reductase anchor subunit